LSEIFCIIDGMTDKDFRLEDYPFLSSFPERLSVETAREGEEPESLSCILSLLGFSAPAGIRSRVEALGAGMPIDSTDTVFRGTWLAVSDGVFAGYAQEPTGFSLIKPFRYISVGCGKALVAGPATACGSAPLPYEMFGKPVPSFSPFPGLTATDLRFGAKALHLWAPSAAGCLPNFRKEGVAVCGANVVKGIALALGMSLATRASMTGDTDTNLSEKANAALAAACSSPFVLLHLGGADEASHRKDALEKKRFLKEADQLVLRALLDSRHAVVCASDHGCDPFAGKHIRQAQPKLIRRGDL
jgi:2,3-bisphosphoglycerate-independent phosphoglycerate mutase